MTLPGFISALIVGAVVVAVPVAAGAAFTAHPAAPRCALCLRAQEIQQLDCNSLAQLNQYGGCSGFCQSFAQAWGGASQATIGTCISNCNAKVAQCSGGGAGGGGEGVAQPNCQWYAKGEIRKYICRIY